MKKLILLFILVVTVGYGEGKVNGNIIEFNFGNNIRVNIGAINNDMLRIKAFYNRSKIKENRFFINRDYSKLLKITQEKNFYIIGDYKILEIQNGYELYKGDELLYSSKFHYENGRFYEKKDHYNEEYMHGMGGAAYSVSLTSKRFHIYQDSEYGNQAMLHIPFYFTSGGDAFYYNSNPNDRFKFGKKNKPELEYRTESGEMDYYFYYDKEPKSLVSTFYKFSNSKSMLPKWVFGYIQSKYGYKNEQEVYDLIERFKKEEIPLSALVLDLYWFKHMGDLDWNKEKWPNPKKMDEYLEENGIKLITISEPFYTVDSKNYKEFDEKGIFAKNKGGESIKWGDWWTFDSDLGSIVNTIAPGAKKTLGSKYIEMKESGIDGFWTDLGEPENVPMNAFFNEYSSEEFHNYYNREWSKIIGETMEETYPNYRYFIMSRSGYTGSAKYNISVWSGDSTSSFMNFRKQMAIGINSGLSGFSYWGSDVGGFVSGEKPVKEELFIRWMQFGMYTPVFRTHGAMSPREPWIYGEETTKQLKSCIEKRYNLMPYIYSLAYETYSKGIPMMRPLFFEHPNDKESRKNSKEYYFGSHMLIAPVRYKIKKKPETVVYLPEGVWYDFESLEEQVSGIFTEKSKIERIPVYVREGAIIPMEKEILLIPGKDKSEFVLYSDDGITNSYRSGDYEAIKIVMNKDSVVFSNVKEFRKVRLKIVRKINNKVEIMVEEIELNKNEQEFKF